MPILLNKISNGITVKVKEISQNRFSSALYDKSTKLGELSTIRKNRVSEVRYSTSDGHFLEIIIKQDPANPQTNEIALITRLGKANLSYNELFGHQSVSNKKILLLDSILKDIQNNRSLMNLLVASTQISSSTINNEDCVSAITDCIVTVAEYLGGIGSLIGFCGETLGLTCIGANLMHPVLGVRVGLQCRKVFSACKATSTELEIPLEF